MPAKGVREKEFTMKFKIKGGRLAMLLVPALALAAPAFAQVRSPALSDSQEPGSVLVFPKQIQGSVSTTEGALVPITELEIGIVCPKGVTCPEHESVKLRLHWVCGTTETQALQQGNSFICQETDFDLTATVFEKIVLTPNGESVGFYTPGLPSHFAPPANCPNDGGYLIAWVINPANDTPIKFDGLVGDAHLRPGSPAASSIGSPSALADYNAIPIQADPGLANLAPITTNSNGGLIFDGAPGHYQAVTGQVIGDVRYTNFATGPLFTDGLLTLLTLDVRSNRPNNPTFVDLDFFGGNPSAIGNENQLSTFTEFVCWEEIELTDINTDLTTLVMGRKGVFVSDQAVKVAETASDGVVGPVPLLGLSEVLEGNFDGLPQPPWPRASFTGLFNSSVPVIPPLSNAPIHFQPAPSSIFLQ
jgi:hypothetical protein